MRSARFFLACAVVSVLAACGTDPVAPELTTPGTIRHDETTSTSSTLTCSGTLVTKTLSDGTTVTECWVAGSKQWGSGG